ncbi:ATP-grasp domain-containing protein [Demequina sp.]|uniref:ATP-grasp domain-containing protein n=1 Tax=Demequina sp. TaxID=2050685 RepID=UPI003D0EBED9
MPARIALVSTRHLDTPDVDEELLLPLLPEAQIAYWDDPDTDWAAYELVILRSTWNYTEHLSEFLAWATRVSQVTRLVNPVEIVEWNTDKRYLADLAERGIPIVSTTFVAPGEEITPDAVAGHVVVKPSVGAGSKGAKLFDGQPEEARAHAAALHNDGATVMIQPYQKAVDEQGETALIFLGGRFSHAARKAAILSRDMSWSTGLYADEKVVPTEATPEELELAERIVAELPDLAYTRVDLLPSDNGPVVLELELTEPSLFLALHPQAPATAAAAFRALLV